MEKLLPFRKELEHIPIGIRAESITCRAEVCSGGTMASEGGAEGSKKNKYQQQTWDQKQLRMVIKKNQNVISWMTDTR